MCVDVRSSDASREKEQRRNFKKKSNLWSVCARVLRHLLQAADNSVHNRLVNFKFLHFRHASQVLTQSSPYSEPPAPLLRLIFKIHILLRELSSFHDLLFSLKDRVACGKSRALVEPHHRCTPFTAVLRMCLVAHVLIHQHVDRS